MNDEIKEILESLDKIAKSEYYPEDLLYYENCKILLDYITNLQKQLHQASLDIQELTERDIECPSWCDKLTYLQQEIKHISKVRDEIIEKYNDLQQELEEEKRIEEADLKTIQRLEAENETLRSDFKNQVEYTNKIAEENERLKEELFKSVNNTNNSMELTENYKSRCEKAIEMIKKQKKKMYKSRNKIALFILLKLENILQGENNGN